MPIVVSDTSPVRALDCLRQLDLLSRLFDSVLVPPAVRDELLRPRKRFRPVTVEEIPGVALRAPSDTFRVAKLLGRLQPGEAEAKARGLVPAVLPLLERLQAELGFFLSPKLLEEIRRGTGE